MIFNARKCFGSSFVGSDTILPSIEFYKSLYVNDFQFIYSGEDTVGFKEILDRQVDYYGRHPCQTAADEGFASKINVN